jgi:hypothetical protein
MSLFWSSPLGRLVIGLGVFTFAFWALAAATFIAWSPSRGVAMAAVARAGSHRVHATDAAVSPRTDDDSCSAMCDEAADNSYSYSNSNGSDEGDDFGWAVIDAGNDMVIDGGNVQHVRGHARRGESLFWFRDGDDEFWVTDPSIVDQAKRATANIQRLGQEMGKVGAEMGQHGAEMGRLGGRMGAIGARVSMVEARIASNPNLSSAERERQRELLHQMREQLRELQRQLDTEQGEHERSQRELSRRMSELSAQHQAALREARAQLRELARRARREGKAERPHANA